MGSEEFRKSIERDRIPSETWWPLQLDKSPEFTTWTDEQLSWKHGASILDMSGAQWYSLTGPDATRLLSDTCVNSFEKITPGLAKHYVMCRDDGKILFDSVVMLLGENRYRVSISDLMFRYYAELGGYDVDISATDPCTSIQVSGPNSFKILQRLTDANLEDIKFSHFNPEPINLAGYPACLLRITMSGERGFEIQVPMEAHDDVYQKIFEAGQDLGIRRIGSRNHLAQHIEAAMPIMTDYMFAVRDPGDKFMEWAVMTDPFAPVSFCPKISGSFEPKAYSDYYVSPIDLGWERLIHFDHEFRGRKELEEEVRHPRRKFVTLEWNKEDIVDVYASMFTEGSSSVEITDDHYDFMDIPRDAKLPLEANTVLADGKQIAFTTSRSYSYSFRKMLSFCSIPIEYSELGTPVEIVWGQPGHKQKNIRATVQRAPYKQDRSH